MQGLHAVWPVLSWKVPAAHLSQVPRPDRFATDPAAHFTGLVAPTKLKKPSVVRLQSDGALLPTYPENLPATHIIGVTAPNEQYPPAVQLLQAVLPSLPWKVPAGQGIQVASPGALLKVPVGQGRGAVEPEIQNDPAAGQMLHPSAVLSPVLLPKRPPGHSRGAADPSGQ